MKKQSITLITLVLFTACSFAKTNPTKKQQQKAGIRFIENKGQVHDQDHKSRPDVLYSAWAGNMLVHLKNNGVSYQLYSASKQKKDVSKIIEDKSAPGLFEEQEQTIYRIDLSWVNPNKNFTKTEEAILPGFNNYYLANCPQGISNVKSYKGITLNKLYNGIDLHYYEKNGELKHDYIVAAHADYKQIQVKVEGAEISAKEDGSLMLTTPFGQVQEGAPLVYQNKKLLTAKWVVVNGTKNSTLSFEIENYNPDLELIIDPVTRLWGTFYGGGPSGTDGIDYGYACATDGTGNVYMTGEAGASAADVIATSGSHQSTIGGGGSYDAFLVKFDANGNRLWGTYYGGTGNDLGTSCAVDGSGYVYMSGSTGTNGFGYPIIGTVGAHQLNLGGNWDAFLVKFDANGVRQWGTYYGGTNADKSTGCAVDGNGNVFMTGFTSSGTGSVIATFLSHDYYFSGGPIYSQDAFLVKFNSSGVRQWGTYFGGTEDDWGYGCATDTAGNIYMTGTTRSDGVIATSGSHQNQPWGNYFTSSYLVKFNTNGTRQWSTYYSGSGDSEGKSCVTDIAGNVYLAGYTQQNFISTDIASPGSHQSGYAGGSYDAYLAKFNSGGVRQWGTYYGGVYEDYGFGCTTDGMGNVYLTGYTGSYNGTAIATADSHQPVFGGNEDAFLAKFNTNGIRQWGTFYGGIGSDYGFSCSADVFGVFMAGVTSTSYDDPAIATSTSHQPSYGGGSFDAYLVKFDACNVPVKPSAIDGDTTVCIGQEPGIYNVEPIENATDYFWELPADWLGTSNSEAISASPGTSGIFSVTANNACGASLTTTLSVMVSECTGIYENNLADLSIKIYPNPTKGIVNVELDSDREISIVNALGQIVYSSIMNSGKHQIDLSNLEKGIYLIRYNNLSSKNFKIIRE